MSPNAFIDDTVHAVRADESARVLDVWEASVRATHDFLSEADIQFFKPLVLGELYSLEHLVGLRDREGTLVGFAGVSHGKLEALFVHPACHRRGVGRILTEHAVTRLGADRVDVNEQNRQAVAFYEHLGYVVEARSEFDSTGKPFPLLHMRVRSILIPMSDRSAPAVEGHDGLMWIRGSGVCRDWNGIRYKLGMSGKNVGAQALSMNVAMIPPGGIAGAHIHVGFEVMLYILEGRVRHEYGEGLANVVDHQAGDFIFIAPGIPHEVFNLSDSEPVVAVVARSSADEWDRIVPYQRPSTPAP